VSTCRQGDAEVIEEEGAPCSTDLRRGARFRVLKNPHPTWNGRCPWLPWVRLDGVNLASNLGNALVALFRATGRRAVLEQARGCSRTRATRWPVPRTVRFPSNLAACPQERYDQTGEISHLDEAIEVFGGTVDESARRGRPGTTAELRRGPPVARRSRSRHRPVPDEARTSPAASVIRAAATSSLGNALSLRFGLLGQDHDMIAAISAHEEAVRNAKENSMDRAMHRANLGVSLMHRGEQSGSAEDFDAAVREQALAAAEVRQTSQEHIRVLSGLADTLAARA
jgi:hypothetical protein